MISGEGVALRRTSSVEVSATICKEGDRDPMVEESFSDCKVDYDYMSKYQLIFIPLDSTGDSGPYEADLTGVPESDASYQRELSLRLYKWRCYPPLLELCLTT